MRAPLTLLASASLVAAGLLLAGCTTDDTVAPPATLPSAEPQGPVGPTAPAIDATTCLDAEVIATATGLAVTASSDAATPPAGPIDAALAGTPRKLCAYDLANSDRVGYTPLVPLVGDPTVMDAAIVKVVGQDDCTQASGYLASGQNAYYVWTGKAFAAAYLLVGDQTDPEAWLAKIVDDAGLCVVGSSGL